mmetsp:Transcript_4219/g.8458  ORF Transcript_4219/g.8458 Transcript_4219/m.8458 type:complete len:184 (+) Transcript_4219:83-634(+)
MVSVLSNLVGRTTPLIVSEARGLSTLQTQFPRCRVSSDRHVGGIGRISIICMAKNKVSKSRSKSQAAQVIDTKVPFGLDLTNPLIKKSVTVYIPAMICVLILMYIDAAYSGDWSRIGIISKSQEEFLRQFAIISVVIHGGLGIGAASISKRRGEKTYLSRGLKTFIVGIVGFSEVLYITEDQL